MKFLIEKIKKVFTESKTEKIKKKLGFYSDNAGILNRYIREQENWQEHLQNTKKAILKSAFNKQKGIVVVLGSGWLLDVPLKELSEMFEQVYLIDIVHSKQVTHQVAKMKNVQCIEYDVSGGVLEGVFDLVKNKSNDLDSIVLENKNWGLSPEIVADFVISVNILSQLDYFALSFLRKNTTFCELRLGELKQRIQQAHLSFLPKGKSCVITDFKEIIYRNKDKENILRQNNLLKVDIDPKSIFNRWIWNFDTQKTYYSDGNTYMNVLAANY